MNAAFSAPPLTRAHGIRSFDRARPLSPLAWQFDWCFASDERAFDGHFPHQPILAGVFLLEMAQHAAEFALHHSGHGWRQLLRVDRFRFYHPVLPGDLCTLIVEWPQHVALADAAPLTVAFSKGGTRVAHGRLLLTSRSGAVTEDQHAS